MSLVLLVLSPLLILIWIIGILGMTLPSPKFARIAIVLLILFSGLFNPWFAFTWAFLVPREPVHKGNVIHVYWGDLSASPGEFLYFGFAWLFSIGFVVVAYDVTMYRDKRISADTQPRMAEPIDFEKGIRSAQLGILVNAGLAVVKLIAGVVGNAYVLIADAVESAADIVSSLIVLAGLQIARRNPDETYPFGYGRAETLAAAVVALLLLGTAVGITVEAIREILTPHHAPAPWTLGILVAVMIVKWVVARRVGQAGEELGSKAVQADAWHHLSDAVTSAAAFIGISVSLLMGPGWEMADDYAAIFAAGVIAFNGGMMLRDALRDLMDRAPDQAIVDEVRRAAESVEHVLAVEKLAVRRAGLTYFVDIHVQAAPDLPLKDAHDLGGRVKASIRHNVKNVTGVLVHMEPFHPPVS